ncbi:MAG TPA: YwiC-like family protein [Opitutaceae bacterium]|nr:YwiC-like family protein [Opitutaceae bacterium]
MSSPATASLRHLLLPREHGSWSLAGEPVALGLLAAPSPAGAALAFTASALFLARRPWQCARGRLDSAARRTALLLLGTLAACAGAALFAAGQLGGGASLWPALLALPPAAVFLVLDSRGESRAAEAELAGAAAFATLPAAFATLAGWDTAMALGLAAAMLLRAVPAVLVVRAFLRRRKGRPVPAFPALAASAAAAIAVGALHRAGLATVSTVCATVLLLLRALWLLGPAAPALRAPLLGALEAALGAVFVLATALG